MGVYIIMDLKFFHDSRRIEYRSKFGAVASESTLTLRLDADCEDDSLLYVRIWQDGAGEKLLPMQKRTGTHSYEASWEMPSKGCLLWYYFLISRGAKKLYYGNNQAQSGGVGALYDHEPPSYQITVYDKDSVTPDWFKNGVVYQIFPDRFYHSEQGGATLKNKRYAVIHSCWDDVPYYCKKDGNGPIVQYDFFGGNLAGIQEKLPYLKDLGITVIYLNPIFESQSNHRYDTSDYKQIDPFLGTETDLRNLCAAAAENGMKVILDGVFSHTGDDSIYFNKYGNYHSVGAYQSKHSPYYEWYKFEHYPKEYHSWWGVGSLPEVEETTPSYLDYIIYSPDSVLKHWLNAGISGWRLDVADELPPLFLKTFWKELKALNPDSILIGEVWEDASNKVSYGEQRQYLCGKQLDSVMNYVLRSLMLDLVLGNTDVKTAHERFMHMFENYPKQNMYAMLNLIGSHDVERVFSLLGANADKVPPERPELEKPRWQLEIAPMPEIKPEQDWSTAGNPELLKKLAAVQKREKLAQDRVCFMLVWQMTLPGAPCVYYGDEVGLEGMKDPDNRRTYPWGHENLNLHSWCRQMIHLRKEHAALRTGRFIPLLTEGEVYAYARAIEGGKDVFGQPAEDGLYIVVLNSSSSVTKTVTIYTDNLAYGTLRDLIHFNHDVHTVDGNFTVTLPPLGVMLLEAEEQGARKRAGVLLHPTSLPSSYGMGDLGRNAYRFVDFLQAAGQTLWQILPLTPPGDGDSPYLALSAFAGNEKLISLDDLVQRGWLEAKLSLVPENLRTKAGINSYDAIWHWKRGVLRQCLRNDLPIDSKTWDAFYKEQAYWLDDYALYRSLKDYFRGRPWFAWPKAIKNRQPEALVHCRRMLKTECDFYKKLQYVFFLQWGQLKRYANERRVKILGDMPIFVAHDSSDCWAHQDLFQLDAESYPEQVAGVPPDYFSPKGQVWGNPLYDWDKLAAEDYDWWQERFRALSQFVDEIRIDHFRGFASYWSVKRGSETAAGGQWIKGPGSSFFKAIKRRQPKLKLVAEDLGVFTPDVGQLKDELGLPGMRILQFHIRERGDGTGCLDTEPNCLVYTGTHDNNTVRGWYEEELSEQQRRRLCDILGIGAGVPSQEVAAKLVEYLYSRRAETAILPMQDVLGLPGSARMNVPGTPTGNWRWQLTEAELEQALTKASWLAGLCAKCKR